jgi:carbamoyltransferase
MYTLGINAAYHDPAAALVQDGDVVAAAEEERFTHIKHGKRPLPFSTWELPFHAIDFCLKQAGIDLSDIDHVAYSYDPSLLPNFENGAASLSLPTPDDLEANGGSENGQSPWDHLFYGSMLHAPNQLRDGAPHHLQERMSPTRGNLRAKWHNVKHHLAHAASAYLCAPFDESAVMTLDGRGERAATTYGIARGIEYQEISTVDVPHSLGLMYEEITHHLGFLRSSDEYKVMALASFGKPTFLPQLRKLVHVLDGGQYEIAPLELEKWFGPRRRRGGPMEQRHFDLAHSLQAVLQETVIQLAQWLHAKTGLPNLSMAGGVALNCVMNSAVMNQTPFEQVWVQPAAGDAGTALGAALWVDAHQRKLQQRQYRMHHAFLGPEFKESEIEDFLSWSKLPYRRLQNVAEETAEILAAGKVIGWFQGRMEFGPRALGGRSILASPIPADMQARLNEIKDREDFRPVAPVVMEEHAAEWFVNARVSPFMLFVYDVAEDKASRIPAVKHVDGTARIQTINRQQNPAYYDLLNAFHRRTGVPVLVNTSFNTRSEPIVCTPRDAVESFWTSPLDALVIGPFVLQKS